MKKRMSETASPASATTSKTSSTKPIWLNEDNSIKLLNWDEIEPWQRDNDHIKGHYFPCTCSYKETFFSIFKIHNETGNVYTHLIPGLFIIFTLFTSINLIESPVVVFDIGCATCLGCSAFFHLMKSHSERVAIKGNKFDYLGICILVASSMVALFSVAFRDKVAIKLFFTALCVTLGTICGYASLSDTFRHRKYRTMRALIFIAYGLSGLLPVLTGFYVFGAQETWNRTGLGWLIAEGVLYIGGASLYAVRFPERMMPGNFDLVGHSHQIFHVMVVLAAYSHYRCLKSAIAYMN